MSRDDKRRRKARRARKAAEEALQAQPADGTRVRSSFSAKERSGSAVAVDFTFSGVPVPVADPEEDLSLKHQVQAALFDQLSKDQEES